MSAMDIDKPLDEIIASKPRAKRGSGRARGPSSGRAAAQATPASVRPKAQPVIQKPLGEASKIIISNLPADVSEAAVRDLMQSTVGPVKFVQLNFNSAGKSTGVATVLFKAKGDGNKAHAAYNNRMIDNQRPMKVEVVVDPNQLQSLASRVAPTLTRSAAPARGRPARGGGKARAPRPVKKTTEDLDAELNAYKTTAE